MQGGAEMIDRNGFGLGIAALLLVSACGEGQQQGTAATPEATPSPANVGETNTGADNATAIPAEGLLSKYVGKHPSELVGGTRFLDEPVVQKAVAASVPEGAARKFVFGYDGPDAPIVAKAGRILAWGCERHNCGYHNWSVAITPEGTAAEVCYYRNDDQPDGQSIWYLPGGKTEQRAGNCPSE
jgi:hypothetical protein